MQYKVLQYKFEQQPLKTTIGYNPIIGGIPTQKNTIYTALKLIERQMEAVGGCPPITTLDLQLYISAQEIRFANREELGHHIIRLGVFHVHEQVWQILGKKYAASGLFGPNAASVIMNGGNYKKCTIAHSLMYETICRPEWKSFGHGVLKKDSLEETMHPSWKSTVKECSRQ